MALTAVWNGSRDIWRITTGERFTLEEVIDQTKKTKWGDATRFLWDLRALTQGPDSTPELRRAASITETDRLRWPNGRIAMLVERDYDFGIARMFKAFAEISGMSFEVFRDEDAALAWLAEAP